MLLRFLAKSTLTTGTPSSLQVRILFFLHHLLPAIFTILTIQRNSSQYLQLLSQFVLYLYIIILQQCLCDFLLSRMRRTCTGVCSFCGDCINLVEFRAQVSVQKKIEFIHGPTAPTYSFSYKKSSNYLSLELFRCVF